MSDNLPMIPELVGPPNNGERISTPAKAIEQEKKKSEVRSDEKGSTESASSKQLYLDGLKEANVSREEAIGIIDAVLTKGVYEETSKIFNRIEITLATRSYDDLLRTARLIDNLSPQTTLYIQDLLVKYNLAASLKKYGSTVFTPLNVGDTDLMDKLQERLDFIAALPEVAVKLLHQKLYTFESRVRAVFAEGAPEDF
jgi:hypothetical protein